NRYSLRAYFNYVKDDYEISSPSIFVNVPEYLTNNVIYQSLMSKGEQITSDYYYRQLHEAKYAKVYNTEGELIQMPNETLTSLNSPILDNKNIFSQIVYKAKSGDELSISNLYSIHDNLFNSLKEDFTRMSGNFHIFTAPKILTVF